MVVFNDVSVSFQQENVLSSFSMKVAKGEKVVLSGISGSGKTTLLNLIMGFVLPNNGDVWVNETLVNSENINTIRKNISWLPQELAFETKNCKELLLSLFRFSLNSAHLPSDIELNGMLERLLIDPSILAKQTDAISGGQKQRLLLASILLLKKPLILLDEPSSALDQESTEAVLAEIRRLTEATVISCSHDPLWNQGMDRIIKLNTI